jgi:hypothetical protein
MQHTLIGEVKAFQIAAMLVVLEANLKVSPPCHHHKGSSKEGVLRKKIIHKVVIILKR